MFRTASSSSKGSIHSQELEQKEQKDCTTNSYAFVNRRATLVVVHLLDYIRPGIVKPATASIHPGRAGRNLSSCVHIILGVCGSNWHYLTVNFG
jgi:hypothetical protein